MAISGLLLHGPPTAFCHSPFAAESPFLPRGKGARAGERFLLPSFLFFLLDRRRRPDVANEAWKESDAADIIRKRFYQAQPLSAPFHEIFECLLMVLAGKIEIPCFIVSDSLSHGSKGPFHFLLF